NSNRDLTPAFDNPPLAADQPTSLSARQGGEAAAGGSRCRRGDPQALARLQRVPPPVPVSGFERLTVECGINPLDLSILTTAISGSTTANLFAESPTSLSRMLGAPTSGYRGGSYLYFVPQRFGSCPTLDEALRCLLLKAREYLM